jgi:hypothetical protein
LEEQLQQPTLEKLTGASATQTRKHAPGILCKAWPNVCPRYHGIPLQSPVYVPKKDRPLGFQCMNSHQAATVKIWVDHNEQGIERNWSGRQLRTLNGFETHEAPWKMQSTESQDKPSICVIHYDWYDFGGVISTTFPHATSCLCPVLEGGPR